MKPASSLNGSLIVLAFSAIVSGGCDSTNASNTRSSGGKSTTTCDNGTERCACYGNGTCNAGLVCLSDLCVEPASSATGGATSTGFGQGGAVASGQGGSVSTGLGGTTLVTAFGGSTNTTLAAGGSSSGGLPGVGGAPSSGGADASGAGMTGLGGASRTTGGATSASTGGSANTAGSSGTSCTAATNVIAEALKSTVSNWIGGDPTTTPDDPCGIQGEVYAYSDDGVDKTPGSSDDSVQSPAVDTASSDPRTRLSPCAPNKDGCCISGSTSKWPLAGTVTDYTASVWGGGLGISLNDPGGSATKLGYQGPVKGFNVTLSGTLNGQVVRLGYTQSATDACAPFKQVSALGTVALPFVGSAFCPTWTCTPACIPPTARPFDLQVQVVGGDVAGAFELCITSVTPIL